MNAPTRSATILGIVTAVALSGGAMAMANDSTAAPSAPISTSTSAALSQSEIDLLIFSREEERMARDLYQVLGEYYDGARPFVNIANAEQQHFDAIGTLLDRYGIEDPAAGRDADSYADPALQTLYDDWLAQGKQSLQDAYTVGVALEERDIADLKQALEETSNDTITAVLERLLAASYNHLQAFQNASDGTLGRGSGNQAGGQRGGEGGAAQNQNGSGTQNQSGTQQGWGKGSQGGGRGTDGTTGQGPRQQGTGNPEDCPMNS